METPLNTNAQGRWATALAADETTAQAARSELAGIFWYPIYVFLRAGTGDGETAASRTETVLTRFIDEPASDAPLLREWLLALAQSELAAPNPREPLLTLDREWSEQRFAAEGTAAPAEMFVRRWTLDLLEQAIATLRAEYDAAGQSEVFAAVQPFLDFSAGASGSDSYAQLAAALGVSDGAARKMVFDLRTRYREVLRAALADTVATPEQIASELQTLMIQLPPPDENLAPSPGLQQLNPEQLLARGMHSIQMSTAGGLGWTPPTIAEAARLFPGYEVVKMLGHGGMGAVYQARQESLDRLVALKLLPLEISVDQSFADRFRREARAMAKLNHPNIISVHDFGQTAEGHLFFAMEFVEGASLNDHVHHREGGLPPVEALGIIEQVCEALAYAHEQGIVHRDIKPANVMIDPRGRVKIADFGLARISDPTAEQWGQTMTGVIMGTPDYMSPEQKRGLRVDARSDIYSVGVMFYEMLCKETPQGAFELPSQRCGLPKELDAIITRAIAPQPEKRFQTTTELKQAVGTVKPTVARSVARKAQAAKLKAGAVTSPAKAHAVPVATPPAKKPIGLYLGIGAGVVALVGGGIFLMKGKPAPKISPAARVSTPAPAPVPSAKPAESKPAPAPDAVAVGNEKWVDGLAQWFGGTKTNDDFVGQGDGDAKIGSKKGWLAPLPVSAPPFRDQVARLRAQQKGEASEASVCVRQSTGNGKKFYYLSLQGRKLGLGYDNSELGISGKQLQFFPLPQDFDDHAVHTLELRIVGDLLTASLDGKKVGEKRDAQLAAGHPAIVAKNLAIESFEYANLDPAGSAPAPAPAPAVVASGNEKWVDGLAQWFGGTKTNENFVREANGGARIGGNASSLQPIPASAPKFRDQVVRMRWHGTNPQADAALYVRLARNASGKDASYSAVVKLAKEGSWKVRLSGPAGVLENADWKPLADFKPEASHTMELRVIGDLITVSVDGRKVIEVRDSQLTAGNPAFSGHDLIIESFEYANLDPAAPAPAPVAANRATTPGVSAPAKPGDVLTFGGHRYQLVLEKLKWNEAKAKAEAMGGHLATITSKEENDWARQAFTEFIPERESVWLGGFSAEAPPQSKRWSWVTGESFSYSGWGSNEGRDPGETALAYHPGRWIDVLRNGLTSGFLVEWDDDGTAQPATAAPAVAAAKPDDVLTFGGHRYQLVMEQGKWDEAKAKAEAMGGHLATISSKEEHEWLVATMLAQFKQSGAKDGLFLGAHRKSVGVAWEWIAGEPFGFTAWGNGKPDNDDKSEVGLQWTKLGWDDVVKGVTVPNFLVEWDDDGTAKPAPIAATAPAPQSAPAAPTPPTPAPAKPESEMEKWLAQVDGPQQESYQREVMKPFEAGLAELQKGYLGALDSRIATASTAGQLDVALGWRNELQRFREGGQAVPADDADLATVAAPLVAKALPPLRTQFRTHKAKLDADRLARAKAAFAKYDAMLSPAITQLTQRQRLDDALLLQNKREEVQKAWLPAAPAPAAPAPGAPSTPVPKPLGSGTVAPPAPAPTSKAATAAAIRAAAEWVIAHGGQVEVPGKKITKPEEIPAGALAVQAVTFKLKDTVPTDAELHALTALGAATNVKVENWDAPDSTLIFLQAFGNVGLLQFVGCPQLTDAMLEGLPPMPNVGSIAIKDCPGITGTGLAKLKAPKLNEVSFTRGAPTDAGLAAISQHDGIKAVQAGGPAITDAGVAHLERLRALTKLILSNTSVTPSALTFLAKRKEFIHLDYLNAAAPDFVANAQAIAKIVPNLPTLGVTGKASGPEATRALLGFKSLRSLQWLGSEMNDATFGELAALTDLEGLTCAKANLTDAAVDTVLALKKLADLNLSDNPELTDAGLLKLKPLKKLKAVHFSRSKATEAGAAELKKAIPGVEVFR